jgi:PAS domain S-box-containing protein
MGKPLRALCVGNTEDELRLIKDTMAHGEYDPVLYQVESDEAMVAALSNENWDIILCAQALSRFDFFNALAFAREMAPSLPFIILTDSDGEEKAVEALRLGAHDYLLRGQLTRLVPVIEREMRAAATHRQCRQLEDQLCRSRERLRWFFETAQEGVSILDAENRVTSVNPRMTEMLGYTIDEIRGKSLADFMDEGEGKLYKEHMGHMKAGEVSRRYFEFLHRNGTRIVTLISVSPIFEFGAYNGLLVLVADVSEFRRVQEELRKNLNFLQNLIDTIPIPIFYKTPHDEYIGCNTAFGTFIGRKGEDIIGKNPFDLLPKEIAEQCHRTTEAVLRNGSLSPYEFEMNVRGELQQYIGYKALFYGTDGKVGGVVGTMIDITGIKRMEKEKERMQLELIQSGKLAALGQLAAGVAHELNNPLTIIMGNMQYLLDRNNVDEERKAIFAEVEQASQRCRDIVASLLAFVRNKESELQKCDINGLLGQVLRLASYQSEAKNVHIIRGFSEGLPEIEAHGSRLEQVFLNICTNAVQAMHGTGTLTVRTHCLPDEGMVEIAFEDTGDGISPEVLVHLFEPFFTTKVRGTGLGLAISYSIIRQHGGDIKVESSGAGQGAVFTITLPLRSPVQQ